MEILQVISKNAKYDIYPKRAYQIFFTPVYQIVLPIDTLISYLARNLFIRIRVSLNRKPGIFCIEFWMIVHGQVACKIHLNS